MPSRWSWAAQIVPPAVGAWLGPRVWPDYGAAAAGGTVRMLQVAFAPGVRRRTRDAEDDDAMAMIMSRLA